MKPHSQKNRDLQHYVKLFVERPFAIALSMNLFVELLSFTRDVADATSNPEEFYVYSMNNEE